MGRVAGSKRLLVFLIAVLFVSGCASMDQAEKGGLAGAGLGALAGQIIGGNTTATLIGTGVGMGLGYLIGNEMDKKQVQGRTNVSPEELAPLAGTSWEVVSVIPRPQEPMPRTVSYFDPNGTVVTTRTFADGRVERETETYRIVGSTLILNKPDYVVNSRFWMEGGRLYLDTGKHSVEMQRI